MSLDLILDQVELADNKTNDNTFDVFCDINTKQLHAFENDVEIGKARHFIYELTDTEQNIAANHREEILEYCLSKVLPTDKVTIADIFLHGKFIKKIS